ncbi:MAG: hypothetical protein AAGD43_04980 [Pseudomonadota bacterium]
MTQLTFFNLGNADTCLFELQDGRRMLVDYAHQGSPEDKDDPRSDLPTLLRKDLVDADRDEYAVVAFSHLDTDHVQGASEFFHFDHAKKYQGGERKKIEMLWVPASAISEVGVDDDGRVIREEARHRLKEGYGIRVFSRPERLKDWLKANGLKVEDRASLFVDAGQLVRDFALNVDGVEFFAHSPHAKRINDRGVEDRNGDALVFQARFLESGSTTDVLMTADVDHEVLAEIVDITRAKKNDDRLHWNVYKLPHHCSYKSIGPEKGKNQTVPTEQIKWLCEEQGEDLGYVISTSKPIPVKGTDEDDDVQPPHRQAANYYKNEVVDSSRFLVTMEHPNQLFPKPIVIKITGDGAYMKRLGGMGAAVAVSSSAPRAGRR